MSARMLPLPFSLTSFFFSSSLSRSIIQTSKSISPVLSQCLHKPSISSSIRAFSASSASQTWLFPKNADQRHGRRGQVHVATGGSTRGTTCTMGDYGLRMKDAHRRISALQLRNGEDTIRRRLRGMQYKLYMRVSANIPIWKKGNEVRMGGGKGSFDHWAARVPVSRIIFELKGEIHEKVARDAFRLAAAKMPGTYEFAKKTDPPVMGITKLDPEFIQELLDSKQKLPYKMEQMRAKQKAGEAIEVNAATAALSQLPAGTPRPW